jgi:hypothetical protein
MRASSELTIGKVPGPLAPYVGCVGGKGPGPLPCLLVKCLSQVFFGAFDSSGHLRIARIPASV